MEAQRLLPGVQWQIYDWFGRPMVSYYYIKRACEPLHVQLNPLDATITVVNTDLSPRRPGGPRAGVRHGDETEWEKKEKIGLEADTYQDTFAVPAVPDLTPVYFVQLDLADAEGKPASSNFYWQGTKGHDLTPLNVLPPVTLDALHRFETRDDETIVNVRLGNPTDRLAFFIHLAVTDSPYGEEVLPVFWDDNYFSLLPGKSGRCQRKSHEEAGQVTAVEVGGWNIESAFECAGVDVSKPEVRPNEEVVVTASIANTFIDGSRVALLVDDKPVVSRLVWPARARRIRQSSRSSWKRPGSTSFGWVTARSPWSSDRWNVRIRSGRCLQPACGRPVGVKPGVIARAGSPSMVLRVAIPGSGRRQGREDRTGVPIPAACCFLQGGSLVIQCVGKVKD